MKADRRFLDAHIGDLTEIERDSFCPTESGTIFDVFYPQEKSPTHLFVEFYEKKSAGYLVLTVVLDEAEILSVAVAPALRRQGIAERLVAEALDFARQNAVAAIHLEVREGNRSARALYEKMGFNVVGKRKSYYTHPDEDAVVMRKDVEAPCTEIS